MIAGTGEQSLRLGIFVTHPIQYFAPLWRQLAATRGLDVEVYFFSDHSVRGGRDPGFGLDVAWDVGVLDGYPHRFVTRDADVSRPGSVGFAGARRELGDGGFDAVMIHGYRHRFERQVTGAAAALGIPAVLRGELTDRPRPGSPRARRFARDLYLRWFYRRIDRFCYVGAEARDHLLRRGVPESEMFYSPYSVDTDLFADQVERFDRAAVRSELGIAPDQRVVLYSGKFIPRKNVGLVIEALERLADAGGVTLVLVGDGEERDVLLARGRALLGERLIAPGFVNQSRIGYYFQAADLFVLPSRFETWGLVVNEAMQFGLPAVVSSRVGCHRDLVIPGETGAVLPEAAAPAPPEAIRNLLRRPAACPNLGRRARQHIAGFTTETSVRGILAALGLP